MLTSAPAPRPTPPHPTPTPAPFVPLCRRRLGESTPPKPKTPSTASFILAALRLIPRSHALLPLPSLLLLPLSCSPSPLLLFCTPPLPPPPGPHPLHRFVDTFNTPARPCLPACPDVPRLLVLPLMMQQHDRQAQGNS